MGNSMAYRLCRESDGAELWAQARRLCALMSEREPLVDLVAELQVPEDVWRMAEALPEARFHSQALPFDDREWSHVYRADALPSSAHEMQILLPFHVEEEVPAEGPVDAFVRALGYGPASVYRGGYWPDVPELGIEAYAKYEAVQAVFNSDGLDGEEPAGHHTLFVHLSKWGDLPRAEWLAGQLGTRVIGEAVAGR
ncbi:hypothetical protein [Streptomyces sp. enrichment culture]|uniref:hypothetical protein n=1 Tax=Streptomyces sp. enrichment culture TaxID=1795815 RepID=UPI003F54A9C1